MDSPGSPEPVLRLARGYWEARVILSAAELRLFDYLEERPRSAADLASAAQIDARGAEIVLHALTGLGLLEKHEGLFRNTASTSAYFVSTSPASVVAVLDHYTNLWDTWSQLTEVIRSGKPATRSSRQGSLEAFILAMHGFARSRVAKVVDAIDLSGVSSVLDIGGGPGTYSCEFAHRNPRLKATVLDFPDVLVITRRIAEEAGLDAQVGILPGDVLTTDLGSGYDLILISAVIHSNSPDEIQLIFRKVFAALEPGGQIVVQEFLLDDSKTQPPSAALFAVNMLVGTQGGATYSESEVRRWLAEAGFVDLQRRDPDEFASLFVGRKPR